MPSARQTSIIGRDDEVRAVQAFVADAGGPPRSLAIAGAAGMGKTLLWRSAVDTARAGGSLVLIARATERELDLPYAALADLIGRLAEAHGAALPDLQRSAIAAVLLQADPNVALDVRTVGTAVVAMLERAVASRPVLIAIDDEPWIDAASRETLRFAIRRLPDRARLLVTRRTPLDDASGGLDDALPADSRTRIELQSLSAAALHDMLRERLGAAPARPALTRITDVSAGNPFFALELARAATTSGAEPSGFFDPMTIPASLRELMSARLAALGDRARLVLTAIAALDRPSPATIGLVLTERGEPAQSVDQDLEQLERDRLIVFDDDLRVSHPLITEIVLDDLGPGRRRLLHRLLAGIVTDEDQVARHLALGTIDPDEPIAARIETSAARAARRGAAQVAAELDAAAIRLTPPESRPAIARRMSAEGRLRLALGEVAQARTLADGAERIANEAGRTELDPARAELFADLAWADGRLAIARDRLRDAFDWADDPAVRARIGARLVGLQVAVAPADAAAVADAVLAIVDPAAEPAIAGYVRINRFFAGVVAGRAPDRTMLDEGLRLEAAGWDDGPISSIPLIWLNGIDDTAGARARHDREDAWYRDRGQDGWRAERQANRALIELHAGDWDRAEREIEASCARIEAFEAPAPWPTPFGWRALIDAHRGRVDRARSTIEPLIATADGQQNRQWSGLLWSVAAFVEYAAGDAAAADRAIGEMRRRFDAIGFREALGDRSEPIHVETLLALGERDRAEAAFERLERRGRAVPRPWVELALARSEALLLADAGRVDAGVERLAEPTAATAVIAGFGGSSAGAILPFDRAWNQLVRGRLLRRSAHRLDAAAALTGALAVFDRLGAEPWARQARAELGRVGLRRGDPLALTPTERRIAELAASGLTNREVASAAFVSPKTVEANLSRVYGKLGIRSRAELGARMGRSEPGSEPGSESGGEPAQR